MIYNMAIKDELRKRRNELGLSQTEVGKRMGVTYTTICNIENGKSCTLDNFVNLCKVLGLEIVLKNNN